MLFLTFHVTEHSWAPLRFCVFREFHQFIKGGGLATRFDVFHKFGSGKVRGVKFFTSDVIGDCGAIIRLYRFDIRDEDQSWAHKLST